MNLPELGVGVTYFPGMEPVLDRYAGSIQVLEIEPQTHWARGHGGALKIRESTLRNVNSYPFAKLIHGVGAPVGGSLPPDPAQIQPMLRTIEILRPAWMSEHLSFNRISDHEGEKETLFLLPPRQTPDGVSAALRSIGTMAVFQMPVAIETPVSYLRPLPDEMEDGQFLRAVAEAADCGIVLDLHNLWVNERSGRQSVESFLEQIPLERVWEVHVAGGEEHRGFWLDAHSGPMQTEFYEMACRAVAELPAVRALIFEMAPTWLPVVGTSFFGEEFERLHRLWDLRGMNRRRSAAPRPPESPRASRGPSAAEWECALGRVTLGREPHNDLESTLYQDPGTQVVRELVNEFRAAQVVNSLRLSSRLLMLVLGKDEFQALLERFWAGIMPKSFPSQEGEAFAEFLRLQALDVPHLTQIVDFDLALLAAQFDGEPRVVSFSVAPLPILRALSSGRLPADFEEGEYELTIMPDAA